MISCVAFLLIQNVHMVRAKTNAGGVALRSAVEADATRHLYKRSRPGQWVGSLYSNRTRARRWLCLRKRRKLTGNLVAGSVWAETSPSLAARTTRGTATSAQVPPGENERDFFQRPRLCQAKEHHTLGKAADSVTGGASPPSHGDTEQRRGATCSGLSTPCTPWLVEAKSDAGRRDGWMSWKTRIPQCYRSSMGLYSWQHPSGDGCAGVEAGSGQETMRPQFRVICARRRGTVRRIDRGDAAVFEELKKISQAGVESSLSLDMRGNDFSGLAGKRS